jgi:hypothetical protein
MRCQSCNYAELGSKVGSAPITIEKIVGSTDKGIRAIVDHDGERLDAEVAATVTQASGVLGQSLGVELSFTEVVRWRVMPDGALTAHGLFQDQPEIGSVRIVGDVHNILVLDDGAALFDVYIQSGPEFMTIQSTDLGGPPPRVHDQIEVVVRQLCFYPTWT